MDIKENTMAFEVETRYMRCRALLNAMGHVCTDDKETLLWVFEEEFEKLGEAIGKDRSR